MSEEACPWKEEETPGKDMPEENDGVPKANPVPCDGTMPCADDGCIVGPEAVKGTYD